MMTLTKLRPLRVTARTITRPLSTTPRIFADSWEGRKAKDHTSRQTDTHNVQQDAVRAGEEDRAGKSDVGGSKEKGSRGATEGSGGSNEKAKGTFQSRQWAYLRSGIGLGV